MIRKYWFGKNGIDSFKIITSEKIKNNFKNMQVEMKNCSKIIFSFNWNHDTNYVPFEFKKWIDKVIEYGVFNEGLEAEIQIYNGNKDKEIYLTSIIDSLKFIKAIVKITWK